jgi:myo-inositol-1(or 4)-monophosphatase
MTKELEIATRAAKEAGQILKRGWEHEIEVSYKADRSVVTKIDQESEDKIIHIIKDSFPNHKIIAEESGVSGSSDYCWYVDPLDGTNNYSRRIPICGVNIALSVKGKITVGVFYNPFTDELYTASNGEGTHLNDKVIVTSAVSELAKAVISAGYTRDFEVRDRYVTLTRLVTDTQTKREYGSGAYEFALVASGRLDGVVCLGLKSWDIAAGKILVEEAGGVFTNLEGNETDLETPGIIAAANKELHQQLLSIVI